MTVRARVEILLIVLVLGAAGAFVVSFARGWKPGRAGTDRPVIVAGTGPAIPLDSVHVEVLNASGRPGLARTVTEQLRRAGFDVVYFGNTAPVEAAVVLDRVGRPTFARAVAEALAITEVRTELDSSRIVDVSVVLGRRWSPAP